MVHWGDSLEVLKTLPENSVDAVVTDPPYGLSFMGKKWDYDVPNVQLWNETLRVLKPGGHVLAFGGTRTYHRMVVAIEDAGFEIRDQVQWIYGSGFPKSMNVGKQLPEYEGFGTALKPANEPIVLARKPLSESTVAKNVLRHGTGALNIDGTRIASPDHPGVHHAGSSASGSLNWNVGEKKDSSREYYTPQGRWPANVIFGCDCEDIWNDAQPVDINSEQKAISTAPQCIVEDAAVRFAETPEQNKCEGHAPSCAVAMLDRQSGVLKSGASRFFYVAKASKRERNAGLEGMPAKLTGNMHEINIPMTGVHGQTGKPNKPMEPQQNFHPTVKPIKLMEYLCKLITPPGGIILDPFMGSGSTGVAAKRLGFEFIGIEREKEYCEIANRRIKNEEPIQGELRGREEG